MPKKTYTQINSITLAATSSSVTFSSIPQNFRDLILVVNSTSSTGAEGYAYCHFNFDTNNANYNRVVLSGDGTSPGSATFPNLIPITYRGVRGNMILNIMDYSATDKHKTVLSMGDIADNITFRLAGRWANTSAISSISLTAFTLAFAANSTLTLYGIEA